MSVWLRSVLKAAAFWLATLLVSPGLLSYWVRSLVMGRDRALEGSSQTLSLVPGVIGQFVRRAFYTRVLESFHPSVTVEFGTLFSKSGSRLGENVYVGPNCHIGLVNIERDVLLGPAVQIPSGRQTHGTGDLDIPIREQPGTSVMVTVGAGSWVGGAAVIMADVGRDTVVGAGSVVTRPLPDAVVAVGSPARTVRSRLGPPEAAV